MLSPLAVRSFETRGREEPEEPCGVRTPFQRDRDRLVHSKPFRRLKGKTQVFIDPQGDHYRTRMTHTLETTAISRVVARALRLNEDLVEAIGLGHDTGHTPFGHAGEQALDAALDAEFGRRFRHNEQSWRIARRLNLTHEVCDGILTHTGEQEPETLEGKIVRLVDRVAYINHDIDDAIRYGILREADLPRAEIELLGADRYGADRPPRPRSRRDLRTGRRRSSRAPRSERRCSRCARSCSSTSTSGRRSGPSTSGHATSCRRSSVGSWTIRGCCPRATGTSRERITDYISGHDRPLRALLRRRELMARIKDQSVREVVAAANIVDVVSLRTSLRKASGTRYMGRCPFHEERSASFSVNSDLNLYHCFGCGKGGDVVTFVRETEGLDFVGAIEWLAERFRVTLEYEESSPAADDARRKRERLYAVLDQAAAFFERHLWEGADGEPVRAYLASRGLGEAVAKEFRLGLSPGDGLAGKAREKGFTADELRAAGLTNQRGRDYFPPRLMFPLADARGRVIGFQARKLHDDDPLKGKYVNSPESDLFKKSHVLYGLHLARPAIAKQDRAVVVEGNTDVIALRQAGFEPVVASMGTALTEQHLKELARLTKRLYLCFDSDAAGEEATLRGMERAQEQGFEIRVVTLPPGQDPADAPDGFELRLGQAESYLHYRVRLELDRASDRQEGFVRAREILAKAEDSPERQEALRLVADRLDLPRETLSGIAPARGSSGGSAVESAEEAPRRGCPARARGARGGRRPSRARRFARGARRGAFRARGASADASFARRPSGRPMPTSSRSSRSSTPRRRPRGSRGRPAPRCCFACARRSCGATCRERPTLRVRPSCRRTSRRCARR